MLTYRASPHSYLTPAIICIVIIIFYTASIYESARSIEIIDLLQLLLVMLGVIITVYLWLGYHKLTITDSHILYRSPFGRTKTLALKDIDNYEICIGKYMTFADRFKPPALIIITPKPEVKAPILEINMAVFSKNNLNNLMDILNVKSG